MAKPCIRTISSRRAVPLLMLKPLKQFEHVPNDRISPEISSCRVTSPRFGRQFQHKMSSEYGPASDYVWKSRQRYFGKAKDPWKPVGHAEHPGARSAKSGTMYPQRHCPNIKEMGSGSLCTGIGRLNPWPYAHDCGIPPLFVIRRGCLWLRWCYPWATDPPANSSMKFGTRYS
ncbi:hypothetical protein BDW60DRAFT_94273 [Aspergillus nidulans var. acristatus]